MTNLLLACSASVSVYKACDLASKATQAGHEVRVVLTPHAARLVSPQLFEAVTGQAAYTDEFDSKTRRAAMDHIDLADWAEHFICAPASAGLIGRLAHGLAGDLVSTVSLALPTSTPRLLCPAMNANMLSAPAVARNMAQLVEDGWSLCEPGEGHLACGVQGRGRLAEPAEILQAAGLAK